MTKFETYKRAIEKFKKPIERKALYERQESLKKKEAKKLAEKILKEKKEIKVSMPTLYGHKQIQYKSISKPTEKAKVTFRKTDFLGRVEI